MCTSERLTLQMGLRRVIGHLIDHVLLFGGVSFSPLLLCWPSPGQYFSRIVPLFAVGLSLGLSVLALNRVYLQAKTGRSIGRIVTGTCLVPDSGVLTASIVARREVLSLLVDSGMFGCVRALVCALQASEPPIAPDQNRRLRWHQAPPPAPRRHGWNGGPAQPRTPRQPMRETTASRPDQRHEPSGRSPPG